MAQSGLCKTECPVSDTGGSAHGRSISGLPGACACGDLVFRQDSIFFERFFAGSNPAVTVSHVAKWV